MTDDEIKDDNADCLHEMDEFFPDGDLDATFDDTAYRKALEFYSRAKVTVTFE